MRKNILFLICLLMSLPIFASHFLSATTDSLELEYEYDFTMAVGDSCRGYTNSIVKYTAPDSVSCFLYFENICKGCKEPQWLYVYEEDFPSEEIELRDFPTEFYKYVFANQTIRLVIIHPIETDYTDILSKIKVRAVWKRDYDGQKTKLFPVLRHYSIQSDIIVLPVLNLEEPEGQ